MSALKRKRGGKGPNGKKSKKVKLAENGSQPPSEREQEQSKEITVPAPVSMVSVLQSIGQLAHIAAC